MNLHIFWNDDLASSAVKISSGSFIFLFLLTPNISTVINLNQSEVHFGLKYLKAHMRHSLWVIAKNWHQKQNLVISFMFATEPAMDNTLNCFNNYRSNLLSTQKLYIFDTQSTSVEKYKKWFSKKFSGFSLKWTVFGQNGRV